MKLSERIFATPVIEQDDSDKDDLLSELLREIAALADSLEDSLPDSREKSIVLSRLEEVALYTEQTIKVNDVP